MGPIQIAAAALTALQEAMAFGELLKKLLSDGGREATPEEVAAAVGERKAAEERFRQS